MNLSAAGDTIAFLNTGDWSKKAIAEAKKYADVAVVADTADSNFTTIPAPGSYEVPAEAAYLHYTPNETIRGLEFDHVPAAGVPVVADMSSTILSRPVDVDAHGVIYAGAQKNMGPSGLVVVVVRRDLLGRPRTETPTVWDWTVQAGADPRRCRGLDRAPGAELFRRPESVPVQPRPHADLPLSAHP